MVGYECRDVHLCLGRLLLLRVVVRFRRRSRRRPSGRLVQAAAVATCERPRNGHAAAAAATASRVGGGGGSGAPRRRRHLCWLRRADLRNSRRRPGPSASPPPGAKAGAALAQAKPTEAEGALENRGPETGASEAADADGKEDDARHERKSEKALKGRGCRLPHHHARASHGTRTTVYTTEGTSDVTIWSLECALRGVATSRAARGARCARRPRRAGRR